MTDEERLRWLLNHSGIDQVPGAPHDRHEYATTVAMAAGRDNPTDEDRLNGWRYMIDDAAMSND